jgi:hypothetical protein
MDNTTPPPVGAAQSRTSAAVLPNGWAEVQDGLASAAGLSLLLVEGRQPPAPAEAEGVERLADDLRDRHPRVQ